MRWSALLARRLGCHPSTVRRSPLLAATAARTGVDTSTYLATRPTFLLDGRPWLDRIAYSTRGPDSLGTLAWMLQTACYILIAYLTGMRDCEIKHLTRGCVTTERDSKGTAYRWKITGLAFKGEATTRGVPATWVAGHPAARAVNVLEQIQPTSQPLLFARLPYREGTRPASSAAVLTTAATQQALADFTTWVTAYCASTGRSGIIPAPGHLRTITTSEGYSGRARHGLARVLDIETARATADYLHQLRDRLDHGEAISGPAAHRMLRAVRAAGTRFEGMFLSPRQVRALLTDPALQVHDNPRAFLACNYDPAKALCHRGRAAGPAAGHPTLDRCNPACANIARTDIHITDLNAETARLRAEIASPLTPGPLRDRLAQRADALRQIADRHARTRITSEETDARR